MIIKSLKLTQFRNYGYGALSFHEKFNAMTGLNGVGKTNILDALYYLCLGKSYFSSGDRYVIMQEKDFFRLEGAVSTPSSEEVIVVKCQSGNKKEIEISGKKHIKISDHVGRFLCVIIAPADIQTMLDGSEERRNFLNNTIVQTDRAYLEDLILYNNLLKRRNALLKSFIENRNFNALLLESVTEPMLAPAERIHQKRGVQVSQMKEIFSDTYAEISGNREICAIEYHSQLNKSNLKELMDANLPKDRILGRTTQGIHKDDLILSMGDEPLKNYASQGQLKSFVLSMKLTQYKLLETNSGKKPILLLDDIFDKLDQKRVKHLLSLLMDNNFGQIFLTDTNQDRIGKILDEIQSGYHIFTVENGKVISGRS